MTRSLASIIAGLFDGILPERITTWLIAYSVSSKPIHQDNSHRRQDMTKSRSKPRIRKRQERAPLAPGMKRQTEDVVVGGDVLDRRGIVLSLRGEKRAVAGPKVNGGQRLTRSEVWSKLEGAMRTLRALPDKERRYFVVKSGYPDFVRDYIDAYASVDAVEPRYQPTPKEVSEYLDVLAWARHLDRNAWKLLWWRSFGVSYGVIGKYIGRSDEAARKRFENALTDVWTAANGI